MGNCKYCGKPAGFLRFKHEACEEQYVQRQRLIQNGEQQISLAVSEWIKGSDDFDGLEKKISEIEQASFVSPTERKALFAAGWERSVKEFVDNGVITPAEEHRLNSFKQRFDLTQADLDKTGTYMTFTKSCVLRDVLNGIAPQVSFSGNIPINFQKSEEIVWVFRNSNYLQDKVRREYVGNSQGVSVRVMKGVYYHTGAFKGQPIEHTERALVDKGLVAITSKNIYFAGSATSLRLPYAKIVSFEPFSNGVGVWQDAANAKAQYFATGDGWFTYNLVTNLAKL